jgi:hypothetical protein
LPRRAVVVIERVLAAPLLQRLLRPTRLAARGLPRLSASGRTRRRHVVVLVVAIVRESRQVVKLAVVIIASAAIAAIAIAAATAFLGVLYSSDDPLDNGIHLLFLECEHADLLHHERRLVLILSWLLAHGSQPVCRTLRANPDASDVRAGRGTIQARCDDRRHLPRGAHVLLDRRRRTWRVDERRNLLDRRRRVRSADDGAQLQPVVDDLGPESKVIELQRGAFELSALAVRSDELYPHLPERRPQHRRVEATAVLGRWLLREDERVTVEPHPLRLRAVRHHFQHDVVAPRVSEHELLERRDVCSAKCRQGREPANISTGRDRVHRRVLVVEVVEVMRRALAVVLSATRVTHHSLSQSAGWGWDRIR